MDADEVYEGTWQHDLITDSKNVMCCISPPFQDHAVVVLNIVNCVVAIVVNIVVIKVNIVADVFAIVIMIVP